MSYQALARKWRPRSFETLVGQAHVVKALSHALSTQRLHHAYLFTGTRGVGKTTLSRILAKALNCETGITATPCGVCGACTAIDAGNFIDYIEMDAASNRGVEEMGALLERAVYAPNQGRFKIYMIDEVHMLSNHAFNAMLKTLEEPPEYLKFILATTDPQKIPVTILSRCLQFSLKPMPPSDISQHLGKVLDAENIVFEPSALKLIARNAQGSMRDALSILDQAIAHGHGELMSATVQELLGAVDTTALYALMQALAAQDMARVLQNAKILLDQGLSAKDILQTIATLCSRLAVAHLDIDSLHAEVDEVDALRGLVQTLSPEHIQLMYGVAIKGLQDAPFAPDEYAAIAMPLIRMQVFAPSQQSVTAIAAPASSATIAAPASPATIAADNSATPAPTPNLHTLPANTLPASSLPTIPSKPTAIPNKPNAFSLKQPSDWVSIANSLPLAALARETARTSVCVGVDKLNLHLEVPVQDMAKPLLIDRIKQALRDATGQAWEIHMAVNAALGSTATAPANVVMQEQAAQSTAMQTAKDNLYKDPLVQALVQAGAQVVDASIRPI